MRSLASTVSPAVRIAILGLLVWAHSVVTAAAQETVVIQVPAAVGFAVLDVGQTTSGWPSTTTMSFSSSTLTPGKALRVSVMADTAGFAPPGGSSIPAAKVSWTALGAGGGIGTNGTLSSSSYGLVFQSNASPTSGHVDLTWTLAAPGGGIHAGVHQLTIRWKVESITP